MNQFMSLFYFTASIHIPEKYNLLFISNVSDNLDSVGTITNQICDEFFLALQNWIDTPTPLPRILEVILQFFRNFFNVSNLDKKTQQQLLDFMHFVQKS